MVHRTRILVTVALFVFQTDAALAWETDQLTDRGEPLAEATEAANVQMDLLLDRATAQANRHVGPHSRPARVANVVARAVRHQTSARTRVSGRGVLRALGYGTFSAWLESADIPRQAFLKRTDVYAGIPFGAAPILASAGTCSTVNLGGVRMGTDKVDHFLSTGFRYWNRARHRSDEAAVRYGTRTERTYLGWQTSDAFSFADLHANWQGQAFYESLLDPDVGLFAWRDGEVVRVRDFDWRQWADWHWDELLDPSVYTPRVQRWLDRTLPGRMDTLCQGVDQWGAEVESAHTQLTSEPAPWVDHTAPTQVDPFGVPDRCPPHAPVADQGDGDHAPAR